MAESFDLEPVDWISTGAVGRPGDRTFYLQARKGSELVSLTVEKSQIQWLAQLSQQLLARAGVTVTPDDLDEAAQKLVEPVIAQWRAGSMSLGVNEEAQQFLLEVSELVPEDEQGATARFSMTQDQLVALSAYAAYVVEAGARPKCRHCGRPIDPVDGHVCPSMNGHGPLTV